MKAKALKLRNYVTLLVPLAVVACAQLQGLDSYEKVDCVGDGCDAGTAPVIDSSTGLPDVGPPDAAPDAPPTCPPCTDGTVCDQKSLKCVECLPGTKACAPGQFCDPDETAGYKCVQGCGTVQDCLIAFGADAGPDAEAGAEAGIFDAGGDGGAGTFACCNNRCVDTASDGKNCGACNIVCGASAACCNSDCQDIVSTPTSCGGCGISCSSNHIPAVSCGAKACNGTCETGWADCNTSKLTDGCETNIADDPNKCGGCNIVCSNNNMQTRTCGSGICNGTCSGSFRDCNTNKQTDGCEIDIGNNPAHCGACNNPCSNSHVPTPACGGGVCNGACEAGYSDCDNQKLINGCETKTSGAGADVNNCGGCGASFTCSSNHVPTRACNGMCNGACEAGWADCNTNKLTDGCEQNIYTDANHCGACNQKCSSLHVPAPACTGTGQCTGTCEAGWSDCNLNRLADGCETNTTNDTNRCGSCNTVCPAGTRNCVYNSGDGTSTCTAGYGVTTTNQAFIDACALPGMTRLLPNADDSLSPVLSFLPSAAAGALIPVGGTAFPFNFYATARTDFWFSSNGEVGFGTTRTQHLGGSCPLPAADTTVPEIYAFNDDLYTRSDGVCYGITGAAPNRKVVITFKNLYWCCDNDPSHVLTFSVMLNETGGALSDTVDIVYDTLAGPYLNYARIGIQNNATTGTQYYCDAGGTQFATSGTKIRFIP